MYREMTAEEKLECSSEIIEALKTGGFIASLDVIEKYKKILSIDNVIDKTPLSVEEPVTTKPQVEVLISSRGSEFETPKAASIYAPEHISAVQDDLIEHGMQGETIHQEETPVVEEPKTLVLEPSKPSAPNPWGSAEIVSPGQLKL